MVPNRIVFSAHLTNLAENNRVGPRLIAYYEERAAGGVGLIITEEQSVHPTDHPYERLIKAFDERVIDGYRRLTDTLHRHGTPVLAQINHNGGQAASTYTRLPLWAPSPIADPLFREVPMEMGQAEIDEVVRSYARVAVHCREGGFDGVELQASHSSMLRQFLSPASNRRGDAYGGSVERRARLVREILEAIRAAVGRDWTVGVRIPADEFIEGGMTLDHAVETARLLDAGGLVDYLNTSIGTATHSLYMVEGSMHVPPGYQLFASAALREVTDLPVIGVGRIKDPVQAEQILASGACDLVGMVRQQIADPATARKAREGRVEEIRLCISCNQECIGREGLNLELGCIENPATGHEQTLAPRSSPGWRGPAGCSSSAAGRRGWSAPRSPPGAATASPSASARASSAARCGWRCGSPTAPSSATSPATSRPRSGSAAPRCAPGCRSASRTWPRAAGTPSSAAPARCPRPRPSPGRTTPACAASGR